VIYLFQIFQAQNKEFGIEQYNDRVCVIFESGNPGGEPGEFETFFGDSLTEWCGFDPEVIASKVDSVVGFDSLIQKKYIYKIDHPGEPGAGVSSFSDTVIVILESGDTGEDPGDFVEYIQLALRNWYDGANVSKGLG
jgi:hypothetical protein